MKIAAFLLLYVGPDQMMPVASVLASILGVIMIFWNKVIGLVRRIFGGSKSVESHAPASSSEPPQQP